MAALKESRCFAATNSLPKTIIFVAPGGLEPSQLPDYESVTLTN